MNEPIPTLVMNHFKDAAAGKPEAFSALVDIALEAGAQGRVTTEESRTAAETYAYFAAAVGGAEESHRLCALLMEGARHSRANGHDDVAHAYEEEACLLLRDKADAGDEDALEALNVLRPGMIWEPRQDNAADLWRTARAAFVAMAAADFAAFADTIDALLLGSGENRLCGLVAAEQIARIGAAHEDPTLMGKLAGILWLRSAFEKEQGDAEYAVAVMAECVSVLLSLSAMGDTTVHPYLSGIAESLPPAVFAMFVREMPGFLIFRDFEGVA